MGLPVAPSGHYDSPKGLNPYTGAPFTWLDDEGVIAFHGLERNEQRALHKLIF